MKSETRNARQLFLYGNGDGKRVTGVKALVAATGLHEQTIWKHIPAWQKEVEEMVSKTSESGLALHLSGESMKAHETDMSHLRNLVEANKFQQTEIEDVTEKLEGWMDKFSGSPDDQDKALKILDLWVRTCGQKSTLISQFLSLQKQWTSLAGITDLKEIQITREKALAVGRAKQKLKSEENEASTPAPMIRGGIFARAVQNLERPVSHAQGLGQTHGTNA